MQKHIKKDNFSNTFERQKYSKPYDFAVGNFRLKDETADAINPRCAYLPFVDGTAITTQNHTLHNNLLID